MTVRLAAVPFRFPQRAIEEQVQEFQAAFDELERASGQEKVDATAPLNRAVRRRSISSVTARRRKAYSSNVLTSASIRLGSFIPGAAAAGLVH
jgi:hypothetical protein